MTASPLTDRQVADLSMPLGVDATPVIVGRLAQQIEAATRRFVGLLQEPDAVANERFQTDYLDELKRIADDPARALDRRPTTDGAKTARYRLDLVAIGQAIDTETRTGAIVIGDIAGRLRVERPQARVDDYLRMAECELFDMVCQTLRLFLPEALENLPSNETIDIDRGPAVSFASAFIQIIVDRARERLPRASDRTRKRLVAMLNKSDRRLLDGIRSERQFRLNNGGWPEGELRATIFE